MSGKKRVFEYEQIMETESAIHFLEQVVAGLRSGELTLESAEAGVTLLPGETTKFSVEIKESGPDQTLKLKMKWRGESGGPLPAERTLEIKKAGQKKEE